MSSISLTIRSRKEVMKREPTSSTDTILDDCLSGTYRRRAVDRMGVATAGDA